MCQEARQMGFPVSLSSLVVTLAESGHLSGLGARWREACQTTASPSRSLGPTFPSFIHLFS